MSALMEAPTRLNKFFDACTCGRADKAAVLAIKKELEQKDIAIERLEEEIRRKDTEKDNLIHMQKDLQAQIEEIRLLLESHAAESQQRLSDEQAAGLMQRRARGIASRKRVVGIKQKKESDAKAVVALQSRARGKMGRKDLQQRKATPGNLPAHERSVVRMQARARGKSSRRLVGERQSAGLLPGQQRWAQSPPPPPMPTNGGPVHPALAAASAAAGGAAAPGAPLEAPYEESEPSYFGSNFRSEEGDDDQSVDSDYDYEDSSFENLGNELLAGKLKSAKVYGQEEPPAAEDELDWEVRYFVLYDSGRVLHYDDLEDGLPVGDRGLIDLSSISAVEKVLNVPTFVVKGAGKVYLFKVEPHDEVMMRTWIGAISQELARLRLA